MMDAVRGKIANVATQCSICGTFGNAKELYAERLDVEALDARAYSARRFEGKVGHFRIVRCDTCGLLRSDPIIESSKIEHLYTESHFTYEGLTRNLARTYSTYIEKARGYLGAKARPPEYPRTGLCLLDIGCGNGFVLEEALKFGFNKVAGVEPSREAIAKADRNIRPFIKQGVFDKNSFSPAMFDMITLFQVIEHFTKPEQVLADSRVTLKSGGVILALNHDMGAMTIRLLGERSPVIDLEHLYFFDQKTLREIFKKAGFKILEQGRAWNYHSLGYLSSLLGLNIKSRLTLHLPIGNQYLIARKP